MRYVAENPERIFDKVRECRFFLTMMADFEKEDTEKFLFCTSGFLGAFRSVLYRLFGVTRTKSGIATERKLSRTSCIHTPTSSF